MNVPAGSYIEVQTPQDVLKVMQIGQKHRNTTDTKMNQRSSRSHCVVMLIINVINVNYYYIDSTFSKI